ncbi:MAG TPA: hypothetical protein VGF69_09040 [Thermoanaerobaculia bacterium]|jgi:hypothetical protein
MHKAARLFALLATFATVGAMTFAAPAGSKGEDTYFFNRTAEISRPVAGTVQVYGGQVTVSSVIDGDLLVFGGTVLFAGAGRVRGNLFHGGASVQNAEGRVDGRVWSMASPDGAVASMNKSAIIASLLFVWLIAAVVWTLLSGKEVRLSSVEVRASAAHCFILGLVAFTSFVLTAVVFTYLVPYLVGVPLLVGLAVFASLAKIYGMIAVFHAIGTLVARPRSRAALGRRAWLSGDLAMVVLGVLILGALRFVPVIGTILWGLASVFGVGVALATKFGRREPWFLEYRSAVA